MDLWTIRILPIIFGSALELTPLILTKLHFFGKLQLISVHLSVKAIIFFENTRQAASPGIDRTPMPDRFLGVDFRSNIVKVALAERFYRCAL